MDCSDVAGPTSPAPRFLSGATSAPLGFEANGLCAGSCPPSTPLNSGETKGGPVSLPATLPNGDRFAFQRNDERVTGAMLAYESPFAVQFLGNASGGPSQDDFLTATVYRAFAMGRDGPIDIKPVHRAAMSLGLGEGSSAEAGMSGSKGARWAATDRSPVRTRGQIRSSTHSTIASWFATDARPLVSFRRPLCRRLAARFVHLLRRRRFASPDLRRASARRGFTAPPDVACPPGTPIDEALARAKRAGQRSANIMAMRCFLTAADDGDMSAAYDIGYAAETGIGVVQDPQEAARWYSKAAEQATPGRCRWFRCLATRRGPRNARRQSSGSPGRTCGAPALRSARRRRSPRRCGKWTRPSSTIRRGWSGNAASMMTGVGLDVPPACRFG